MENRRPNNAGAYFDSVQILRAVAAWTVVYHHYIQFFGINFTKSVGTSLLTYGNFGVDVFFLISGFIMAESVRNRSQSATEFMKSRVTRIVPNYWFYTAILLVCCLTFPAAFSFFRPFTWQSVTRSLLFIPNQNPSGHGILPLLTVGWTLNYEMLFYLLFSLCLLLPRRFTIVAVVAILFLLPVIHQYLPHAASHLGSVGILFKGRYLPEFAIGICINTIHHRFPSRSLWWSLSGVAICILSVVYMFHDGRRELAAAGVLWGALRLNLRFNGPVARFAKHLGNTSYSTYLSHAIIIVATLGVTGKPTTRWAEYSIIAVITVLTIAMSELSYRLIELRRRSSPQRVRQVGPQPSIIPRPAFLSHRAERSVETK